MTRRHKALLLALLVLAAALRLWSIDFALKVERARPDEEFVSGIALRMVKTGDLNPHFFHYPTLLAYVNAAVLTAADTLKHPEPSRLVSRVLTALSGVGTVAVLALLGARVFSWRVGLLAASWLAVSYLHVRESHFGTPGVPMTFFVTLAVWLAARAPAENAPRFYTWAALACGLAASVKYPGVLGLAPVGFIVLGHPGWSASRKLREVAITVLIVLACILVSSPYLLLDPAGARAGLIEVTTEHWGDAAPQNLDPWFPLSFSLWHGMGAAFTSLAFAGLVAGLCRRGRGTGWMLLAWVVPYYAAAAVTSFLFARYALPFLPPLCLAAAAFVDRLPLRRGMLWAVATVVALLPFCRSIAFDRLLGREDTRALAAAWIREHLPPDEAILVMRGYGAPSIHGRPVRWVTFRRGAVAQGEREGITYLVTHEHPVVTRFSRIDESLKQRLESAVRLAEFSPFRDETRPGLYDPFDAFYVPYAELGGLSRPGPRVTIWKLAPPGVD